MRRVEAVISDFGGVLTTPLIESFLAYQERSGVSLEDLGAALAMITERTGANPLFELECGRLTEIEFAEHVGRALTERLSRPITLEGFGEAYFEHLHPNQRMIDYMRELRDRGLKLAICTNNVREWEPLWRAKLPVDEIFSLVIDSGFVGTRKPERRIYELTLEGLGVPAPATVLLDDIEVNCEAARELGMQAVWFQDTEQAIAELDSVLTG